MSDTCISVRHRRANHALFTTADYARPALALPSDDISLNPQHERARAFVSYREQTGESTDATLPRRRHSRVGFLRSSRESSLES